MRVVLDTNVLIAAYATRGQCRELLEHCITAHHLVSSEILLDELHEKLTRKLKFSGESASQLLALLRTRIELVHPIALNPPACRDPDDDWVLATAIAGKCLCVVTGDKDLLALNPYRSISIIPPAAFWRFGASS